MSLRSDTETKQAYLLYYRTARAAGNPDVLSWGDWLKSKGKLKAQGANQRTQSMYGSLSDALSADEIQRMR